MKSKNILGLLAGTEDVLVLENLRLELANRLGRLPIKDGRRYPAKEAIEVILSRIDTSDVCGCWKWTGPIKDGYGVIWRGKVQYGAHRLIKSLIDGISVTSDVFACHRCNNPICVNPSHIYWGDALTNMHDLIISGGRNLERGSDRYNSKLTESDVRRILLEATDRKRGWGKAIAMELGVCPSAINNIVRGFRWKHLSDGKKL